MRRTLGQRCESLFLSLENFDANGEARVEVVKELTGDMWKMLDAAGAEITHADVERIIDFMDVNGTGLIGIQEFRATIEKIAEGLSTMGIQEVANHVGLCESKIDKVQEVVNALDQQTLDLADGMKLLLDQAAKSKGYR